MRIIAITVSLLIGLGGLGAALIAKSPRVRKLGWLVAVAMVLGAVLAWWLIPLSERPAPPRGI